MEPPPARASFKQNRITTYCGQPPAAMNHVYDLMSDDTSVSVGAKREPETRMVVWVETNSKPVVKRSAESMVVAGSKNCTNGTISTKLAVLGGSAPSLTEKRRALAAHTGRSQTQRPATEIHKEFGRLAKKPYRDDGTRATDIIPSIVEGMRILTLAVTNKKHQVVKNVYTFDKNLSVGAYNCDEGGMYAHVTFTGLDNIFQRLPEFNRTALLVDIGSGLGLPSLHAATAYCGYAVGVEIAEHRVCEGACLALNYFKTNARRVRNFKVASICADVLHLQPVTYATHIYMFDLCIPEDTYLDILRWIAKGSAKYVVTFKPTRRPRLLDAAISILDAEVVDTVRNLYMSASREGCTALILKRKTTRSGGDCPTRDTSSVPTDGTLIDSKVLVKPFFHTLADTTRCYEVLQRVHKPVESRQTRSKCVGKPNVSCQRSAWMECVVNCSACDATFHPLPKAVFAEVPTTCQRVRAGLFAASDLKIGTVVAIYTDRSGVRASTATNARLQEVVCHHGVTTRTLLVLTTAVSKSEEVTIARHNPLGDSACSFCASMFRDAPSASHPREAPP
jgi:hypothetical protein